MPDKIGGRRTNPPSEILPEDEVFDCMMDQMDPPDVGGYTGLTRKLAIDDNQKNALKKLLVPDKI